MESIESLFIFTIYIIVVLLIIRELVLWYFKINKIAYLLEWQKNILEKNQEQNDEIIRLLKDMSRKNNSRISDDHPQ